MFIHIKRQLSVLCIIALAVILFVPATTMASVRDGNDIKTNDNCSYHNSAEVQSNNNSADLESSKTTTDWLERAEDDSLVLKVAINTVVTATRQSSTKINYCVNGSLSSKADKLTVKAVKCTYNKSSDTWVATGTSVSKEYNKATYISSSGTLSCSAGKTYKVRITITEKRGSETKVTTRYSKTV